MKFEITAFVIDQQKLLKTESQSVSKNVDKNI